MYGFICRRFVSEHTTLTKALILVLVFVLVDQQAINKTKQNLSKIFMVLAKFDKRKPRIYLKGKIHCNGYNVTQNLNPHWNIAKFAFLRGKWPLLKIFKGKKRINQGKTLKNEAKIQSRKHDLPPSRPKNKLELSHWLHRIKHSRYLG